MKKTFLLFALCVLGPASVSAQDVFRTLLDKANTVVNENNANDYNTKINYFYYTALNYMQTRMQPKEAAQYRILDEQSLAMQAFVSDFVRWLTQTKEPGLRKKGIEIYIKASASHPFFDDKDTETAHSFINDPDYITPFSLDTDWVNACRDARNRINKLSSK